jgi:hypothetical protein
MPSNKQQPGCDDPPGGPVAIPFADAKRASVVERDDGRFQIGVAEAPRPFESRAFAEAVAREMTA